MAPATAETSAVSPQEWTVTATGGRLRRGGGRPPVTKTEQDFREVLKSKLPELVESLVAEARKGNVRAIELALAYVVGKPTDKVELSGPDGGPITTHAIARDDHEAQLLRDAIKRELARRTTDRDGGAPATGSPDVAPVASAAPTGAGTS